jgi:hypothetical protein
MIENYHLHTYLMLPKPTKFFGLLGTQDLQFTNVAVTYDQAKDTVWDAFHNLFDESPWMKQYRRYLAEQEKKHGVTLYWKGETGRIFFGKKIKIHYVGADTRTGRGKTRAFTAIDEIGWFDAKAAEAKASGTKIRANARGTYEMLRKSKRTIRSAHMRKRKEVLDFLRNGADPHTLNLNIPNAIACNISSPCSKTDMIMKLVRDGEHDRFRYTFHRTTFEMNPTVRREDPDIVEEYISNPVDARRDYDAIPPLSTSPFIQDTDAVKRNVRTDHVPLFRSQTKISSFEVGTTQRSFVSAALDHVFKDKFTPRVLGIDTGESQNHFAIVLSSLLENCVCVDGVVNIIPRKDGSGRVPVHFEQTFAQVIVLLCQSFNVRWVVWDRWQSSALAQRLQTEYHIESEQYSLRWNDFLAVSNDVLSGNVIFPRTEMEMEDLDVFDLEQVDRSPYTYLVRQVCSVQQSGRQVVKPDEGEDDIWRAFCLTHRYINMEPQKYALRGAAVLDRARMGNHVGSGLGHSSIGALYAQRGDLSHIVSRAMAGRRRAVARPVSHTHVGSAGGLSAYSHAGPRRRV